MAEPQLAFISEIEYVSGERAAQIRHEYVDGHIFAMTGASRRHNLVVGSIFTRIHAHLRGGPCETFVSDMRVRVCAVRAYYYPDIVVSCDPRDRQADDIDGLEHPSLLVDVLSPTTEAIDRREKWLHYRKLDSLREYVLVDPRRRWIEVYRRSAEGWTQELVGDADGEVRLESVGLRLSVADVYEGVEVEPEAGVGVSGLDT